jgi:16S rRNA G966 N2-methylase RsmD
LEIPEAGSYKVEHRFSKQTSIWLIGDRSVAPLNPLNPGNERYYICYQQLFKNENPFYLFDENKPAWKSHTTMPHSLTAALINATRPHQLGTKITDPFGGTGTTWFEAKRLGLPAAVSCSDLSPVLRILIQDNLEFFLLSERQLQSLHGQLKVLLDAIRRDGANDRQASLQWGSLLDDSSSMAPYNSAIRLLATLRREQPNEEQEFDFSTDFVDQLSANSFLTRIVFYVVLRAELRYQGGFKRKATTFDRAFEKSMTEILEQTAKLVALRTSVSNGQACDDSTFVTANGVYSPMVVPSLVFRSLDTLRGEIDSEIMVSDACALQPASLDVIICDPPYGFNTTEDRTNLAHLYSRFLDAALLALREHGHLIICLPAESYTGRDLPYCTYSKLVSNQVIVKADQLGKHVFVPGRSLPHRMLSPPYYWEAERALRRVVLHFRISASEHRLQ